MGSTGSAASLDPDTIGDVVTQRLQSRVRTGLGTAASEWLTLVGDSSVRGQWLVMGTRTGKADVDVSDVLPAAASVELLYVQALANARAAFSSDGVNCSESLLRSDHLHSLAYTTLPEVEADAGVLAACFDSLSEASQTLTSLWARLAESNSGASTTSPPVDPVVLEAAGDMAGILGDSGRRARAALRRAGAALGIARWRAREPQLSAGTTEIVAETVSVEWEQLNSQDARGETVQALLEPVAETPAGETLRSFAQALWTDALDRQNVTA